MNNSFVALTSAAGICLAAFIGAQAAGLDRGEPVEVTIQIGTATGGMTISPGDPRFEKGKYYKLILTNPSDVMHRLSVASFASLVRSQGKPAIDRGEVRGGVVFTPRVPNGYRPREIDIAPGGTATWYFVPIQRASAKVGCKEDSHAKAGMVTTFGVI